MSCPQIRTLLPSAARRPSLGFFPALLVLLALAPSALAAPLVRRSGSGSSVKIWVPILVVVIAILLVMLVVFRKTDLVSRLKHISVNSVFAPRQRPAAAPAADGVRELTAETLAGPVATAAARPAARPARRNNRRTPSQISTRSLPAYNKEPGEHELVIIQGSDELEDVPVSNVVMPAVAEDDGESMRTHSRNASDVSSYVHVPDNANVSTPLLSADDINEQQNENDNEQANLSARTDASAADDSRAALLPNASPDPSTLPDPRGEAPAYFEVQGNANDDGVHHVHDLSRIETTDTLPAAPESSPPVAEDHPATPADVEAGTGSTRRRSMFRGILSALSPRAAPVPPTASETARPSVDQQPALPRPSGVSSRLGARSPAAQTHRPSHSGSQSVFSVTSSAFGRTISRTRTRSNSNFHGSGAAGALTSPSNISINSISSPLTHTLVRTDFVYPRSGPTPEQVKMLSSREAVGKFGVPYGQDARAFASASRVNLAQGPPPEFEERQSFDGLPRPSIDGVPRSSGEGNRPHDWSRLRGHSPNDSTDSSGSSHQRTTSAGGATSSPLAAGSSTPAPDPVAAAPAAEDVDHAQSSTDEKPPIETASTTPRPPSPAVSSSTVSTATATQSQNQAPPLPTASAPAPAPAPTSLAPPTPSLSKKASSPAIAPPTAFRMPTTPLTSGRPESRASSVLTFQTAESSFTNDAAPTPTTPDLRLSTMTVMPRRDADEDEPAPPTPKATHSAEVGA
ncbi:hypothetical protein FA95DRAFT_1612748 [Auriscalpium vulgare]|uniref:Uncharacterized protein n=1 Tax=Auriscalpium vulgare TaxID=40419 RepID=A0ACB8R6P2_9AGAM|nr:hypothetical protein FA95DRAFT_1612748 [Auriscalpium vulgare]